MSAFRQVLGLFVVAAVIAGANAGCAAFDFRSVCDANADCASSQTCAAGFCIGTDTVVVPEPEPDPGVVPDPSVTPAEPAVGPAVSPGSEPSPVPPDCPGAECDCETLSAFSGDVRRCLAPVNAEEAVVVCRMFGLAPANFSPNDFDALSTDIPSGEVLWTGFSSTDGGQTFQHVLGDVVAFDALAPFMENPSDGCLVIVDGRRFEMRACTDRFATLCGNLDAACAADFDTDANNCGGCGVQCPAQLCSGGFCTAQTRFSDGEPWTEIAITGATYWLRRDDMVAAYQLPANGTASLVFVGETPIPNARGMTAGPGDSVIVLSGDGGSSLLKISRANLGVTVATIEPGIAAAPRTALAANETQWFLGGVGGTVLSGVFGGSTTQFENGGGTDDDVLAMKIAAGHVFWVTTADNRLYARRLDTVDEAVPPVAELPERPVAIRVGDDVIVVQTLDENGSPTFFRAFLTPGPGGVLDPLEFAPLAQNTFLPSESVQDFVIVGDTVYASIAGSVAAQGIYAVSLFDSNPRRIHPVAPTALAPYAPYLVLLTSPPGQTEVLDFFPPVLP